MRDPGPSPDRIARYRRGRLSEWLAAAALLAKGYRILGRRVRTPYGEIDLIAVRGRRLAFVEVKRRATRARGRGRHHPAPGRPHRPGGRVLGQPPPGLSRARAGPRRRPRAAGPPAGAPARRPAGDAGSPAQSGVDTVGANALANCRRPWRPYRRLPRAAAAPRTRPHAAHRCLPDGPHRPHRHPGRFDLRPAARGAAARPQALLLHAAQPLAAGRAPDRARLHAARSRTRPARTIACRSRAPRTSPIWTWCCCARTRRSTCPTSPPRTCWSASTPRRWWSTIPPTCAMRRRRCSSSTSST